MTVRKRVAGRSLAAAATLFAQAAGAQVDPEDQKLIDAAGCPELVREYGNYAAAEREAYAQIQRANAGTAAVNVAGIAAFATLGFGVFTWDNNEDAEENLAELRAIRIAIGESAGKKGCALAR
jgi:hypothetical protein